MYDELKCGDKDEMLVLKKVCRILMNRIQIDKVFIRIVHQDLLFKRNRLAQNGWTFILNYFITKVFSIQSD